MSISVYQKLINRAYALFGGHWAEQGDQIVCTFARELVDMNNDTVLTAAQAALLGQAAQGTLFLLNYSFITGLSGGGPTNLDGVPTFTAVQFNTVVLMMGIPSVNANGATLWQFQHRTDATAAGTMQRPLDFNTVINPGVWVRIL